MTQIQYLLVSPTSPGPHLRCSHPWSGFQDQGILLQTTVLSAQSACLGCGLTLRLLPVPASLSVKLKIIIVIFSPRPPSLRPQSTLPRLIQLRHHLLSPLASLPSKCSLPTFCYYANFRNPLMDLRHLYALKCFIRVFYMIFA